MSKPLKQKVTYRKSSPLKGADPVLVKGAYDAAGNELYMKFVQMQHDRLMQIAEEARSWDFGTGAQRIIDSNGKLPQVDLNAMRDQLSGPMRQEYINGDNKVKEQKLAEVQQDAAVKEQYEALRTSFANNEKGGMLSNGFKRTPEGQEIMEILLGPDGKQPKLRKKECPEGEDDCTDKGRYGVYMTDHKLVNDMNKKISMVNQEIRQLENLYQTGAVYGDGSDLDALYEQVRMYQEVIDAKPTVWTSIDSMANMISIKDQGSIDLLEAARNAAYTKGKDTLPEDTTTFNRKKAEQLVGDVVMGSGDMKSLIYDSMWGATADGNSFYDNLTKHIMEHKYSDYGITDEYLDQMGVFDDGQIDQKEAQHIADTFIGPIEQIENNQELREEMKNYYVQYLEQNYNLGKEDRRESYVPQTQQNTAAKETTNKIEKPITTTTPSGNEERVQENTDIIENEVEDVDQDEDEDNSYQIDDDGNYVPQSQR